MARGTPNPEVEKVSSLVGKLAAARTDAARHKIQIEFLKRDREALVENLRLAFKARPGARREFPFLLGKLGDKKVPGAKDALRELFADTDPAIRAASARVADEYGWVDDYVDELTRLAKSDRSPDETLASLQALGKSKSEDAFTSLMSLTTKRFANPFRRGNLLEGLARHANEKARPVFERSRHDAKAEPYARLMGAFGLVQLGDTEPLADLRAALDSDDLDVQRPAAAALSELFGFPRAVSEAQIRKLRVWYDSHPHEIQRQRPARKRR